MDQSKLKKLWLLIREGDEVAFAKVYDWYVDKIYRFVFLKVDSPEAAEEITQDIFLKLWKISKEENKIVINLSALLYQIARFRIIDYYRSQKNESKTLSIDQFENDLSSGVDEVLERDEAIDRQFDFLEIKEALCDLPETYKDIIIMKYVDDLTNSEIAEAINKDEGNVRVLVHRAMVALRKKLEEKNIK